MDYIKVYFEHSNKTVYAKMNSTLSDVCSDAGYPLDLVCGGKGTCGKCKILIRINNIDKTVLACMTKVTEDVTVCLKDEDIKKDAAILISGESKFIFNPSLSKIFINRNELELNHCGFFWEYLNKNYGFAADLAQIKKFEKIIMDNNSIGFTITAEKDKVIQIQNGDKSNSFYGAAIDIGTTSVVMYVYDMKNGMLTGTYSDLNSQISRGGDVISRIKHCDNSEYGTKELQNKIIDTINSLIDTASNNIPDIKENLHEIVACGNSTMQHLFHGLNPKSLGYSPFLTIYKNIIVSKSQELGLNCSENCQVKFLPLLGGFVGADTTSVLLSVNRDNKLRLVVDLGTNGEIAVGNGNKYIVASTACGPALEGAGLKCGMRGTTGAIEKFEIIDGKPVYKVIGNTKPKGICGSGAIDIIAELIKNGIINKSGKMLEKDEFEKKYPDNNLSKFITKVDNVTSFIVVPSEDSFADGGIHITQKDIRQIQLAKSAIYTGCVMLIESYGTKGEQLDEILLSGAFGNYVNIKNAEYIGLIPKFKNVKTNSIGNGAGTGVQMYLLNKNEESKCMEIVSNTTHLELATDPGFQNNYIMNMGF